MDNEKIVTIIKEAIENIQNKNYKTVLKLKLEGYKLKEIAEIAGKTDSAIQSDYRRAKDTLKKVLKERGYILK